MQGISKHPLFVWFTSESVSDPRHFQILTLSLLLSFQIFLSDFSPQMSIISVVFATVFISQIIFSKLMNVQLDLRSPLITGLSLSILLKGAAVWVFPVAAFIAIASKFLVRVDGRHIFNPANIGIVAVLLMLPNMAWVSTGQWGTSVWLAVLLSCLALLVLFRIPKRDMSIVFFICWAGMLFGRALWLGDPLSIPMHQLQSGALLIFAFFMISDPMTIPNRFIGRVIFALAVCVAAFILTFEFRIRESLFYALACVCLIRPILERVFPGQAYQWRTKGEKP